MSPRAPFSVPKVLPCGHLSALSYVAADGLTAWCMVCEKRIGLQACQPKDADKLAEIGGVR